MKIEKLGFQVGFSVFNGPDTSFFELTYILLHNDCINNGATID